MTLFRGLLFIDSLAVGRKRVVLKPLLAIDEACSIWLKQLEKRPMEVLNQHRLIRNIIEPGQQKSRKIEE